MTHTHLPISLEGEKLIPFLPKLKVHFTDSTEWYCQTMDEAVQYSKKNNLTIKKSHPVNFDPDLFNTASSDIYTLQALLNSLLFATNGQIHFDIDFFDKFYAFTQLISTIEEKVAGLKKRFENNYNILDHYKTHLLESRG